jgi:hypothetical protein
MKREHSRPPAPPRPENPAKDDVENAIREVIEAVTPGRRGSRPPAGGGALRSPDEIGRQRRPVRETEGG